MSNFRIPHVGQLDCGLNNLITDVPGVRVGQVTLAQTSIQTGVTVITPHSGDLFRQKVPAAVSILNGFGKSIGLVQLDELGVLETPIALTNTFSVSSIAQGEIRQAISANPEIGRQWATINPLVFECNDGYLNDIQAMALTAAHYEQACRLVSQSFEQGAVGAGRGMSCFGLKGGIGSSSRIALLKNGKRYQVGTLVLANFGRLDCLMISGRYLGDILCRRLKNYQAEEDKGSIIMIVATDAPLDARQLKRLALRASAGLSRTGSFFGNGSGDIALAFSNAYTIPQDINQPMPLISLLHDGLLDPLFQAAAESTEQSIINALCFAQTVSGRNQHRRISLQELAPDLMRLLY